MPMAPGVALNLHARVSSYIRISGGLAPLILCCLANLSELEGTNRLLGAVEEMPCSRTCEYSCMPLE